tara:strand:- start:1077 stop:1415 length:339 start_codon:yes stop_codon:yes gene_type:complete
VPIAVKQSKNGGYAVVRATGTETVVLADVAGAGETVQSMAISEIIWSVHGGNRWTINRGATVVAELFGSGHHDYQASSMRIEAAAELTANCVLTLSGGHGYAVVKLHKVSGE